MLKRSLTLAAEQHRAAGGEKRCREPSVVVGPSEDSVFVTFTGNAKK